MDKYGLIGKKLTHSFSKNYFTKKFDELNISARYDNYELSDISEVTELLKSDLKGFNVTLPYKEEIIPYLDELSDEAKAVGAVNTVVLKNGKSKGFNTDIFGFAQMIKPFFKSHHERSLILGTGGASKAVAYVLEQLGSSVNYLSRKENDRADVFTYEDMNENMIKFHGVIVNTTPVGMFPNVSEEIDLPYAAFSPDHLAIDLIYNPTETLFLKNAAKFGANTLNGLTMLHQQAEKAWQLWQENN